MHDDQPTIDPAIAARGRLVRAARSLLGCAARGVLSGAGSAAGTWIVWWITHH